MSIKNFTRVGKRGLFCLSAMSAMLIGAEALAITVTASDSDGNLPANTLDNDLNTRWSADGNGQWIQYDLGSTLFVKSLDVAFYKGNERSSTIDIQTSADGSSWQSVFYGAQPSSTSAQQNFDVVDSIGRYVRIVGYGNTSNTWNSITEVDVNTAAVPVSSSSAASAAPITASASADDGNVAANVLDNDLNTRWSANGSGAWLQLDLGATKQFSSVNLAFFKGDQRSALFDIQVSTNGSSWTTVLSGATASGSTTGLETFAVTSSNARYVRFLGYGNSANSWNSVTEMSINTIVASSSSLSSSSVKSSVTSSVVSSSSVKSSLASSVVSSSSVKSSVASSVASSSASSWVSSGKTLNATPSNLSSVLATAGAGDQIIVTGSGSISIKDISFSSPVLIRAASIGGTTLTNAALTNVNNIILQGFVFGPNTQSTYLKIVNSTNVQILRNLFDHKNVTNSQTAIVLSQASDYVSIGYNEFRDKNIGDVNGTKITGSYIKTQFDEPLMSKHVHIYRNHFKNIVPFLVNGVPAGDSDREAIAMGIANSQDVVTNNVVEYNLFENCDGENEIITVKTSNNVFRYNTFKNSMGSLSFRLGSNNKAYGNYFYGEGTGAAVTNDNYETGGIRVYGAGHEIYNNYMEGLTGISWRRPILIDSGDTQDSTGGDSHETSSNIAVYNNTIVDSLGGGIHLGGDVYKNMPYNISVTGNTVISSSGILFNNVADKSTNLWSNNQAYATGSATAVGGGSLSAAQVLVLSSKPAVTKPAALTASNVGRNAP